MENYNRLENDYYQKMSIHPGGYSAQNMFSCFEQGMPKITEGNNSSTKFITFPRNFCFAPGVANGFCQNESCLILKIMMEYIIIYEI